MRTELLGSLCEVLDSKRKPVTKRDRVSGPYPYYGATGIQDYVSDYIFDEPIVLVGEDGAKWGAGERTAFCVSGKCWINNHAHVLRPDRTKVLDDWLVYYLNHSDLTRFVSGLTVPKLNQGNLREIPIPLPPLSEQKRIVAKLDEGFEAIEIAKRNVELNLRKTREFSDSYLNDALSKHENEWKRVALASICEQITDGTHNSPPYCDAGVPMLDSKHVNQESFEIDDSSPEKFISQETDAILARRCKPRSGDILISSRGTIGKIAIVKDGQDFNIMGNMILLRLPAEVDKQFAAFYIYSQIPRLSAIAQGVAQKGLYLGQLRSFEIPMPPLSDQIQIAKALLEISECARNLGRIFQAKQAAHDALSRSLLATAFSGNLAG